MFSSLVKKVTPTKTNVAKIFFVMFVLVCFFGFGLKTSFATAVGIDTHWWGSTTGSVEYRKDNKTNQTYAQVTQTLQTAEGSQSNTETFKIDTSGTPTKVDSSQYPGFFAGTQLPTDPVSLNKSNDSGLSYDYSSGTYKYGTETLDPYKDSDKITQIAKGDTTYQKTTQKAADNTAVTGNPDESPAPPELSCGVTEPTCWLSKTIYYVTIVPASALVWMAGWLFDKTFEITVVNLSSTLGKTSNSGFYPIIVNVWSIFRDLINMTFIFILLYAAIITILKADTSGMKKLLEQLLWRLF